MTETRAIELAYQNVVSNGIAALRSNSKAIRMNDTITYNEIKHSGYWVVVVALDVANNFLPNNLIVRVFDNEDVYVLAVQ